MSVMYLSNLKIILSKYASGDVCKEHKYVDP